MTQIDEHLALADLTRAILETAKSPSGDVKIAVVDALPTARAVIEPMVHGAGGTFLQIEDVAADGLSDTLTEVDRHRRIEAALSAGTSEPVRIRPDADGLLRAFYESDTGGTPTVDLILGAGTAALSRALDRGGLLVVAYDETGQDADVISRLWTFLRGEFLSLAAPDSTVFLLCGTDHIDYSRMCGRPPAGRFFVQGAACVRRNNDPQDENTIRFLANGHEREHLVLFLGAGFSVTSGLAQGNELRDIALREYLSEDLKPSDLLPLQFYEELPQARLLTAEANKTPQELAQQLTLERVLRELSSRGVTSSRAIGELERKHDAALAGPGPAVRHLHRILAGTRRRVIIATVNFDQLVEHGQDDKVRVFVSEDDFAGAPGYIDAYLAGTEEKVPVLKVHGSLDKPETLVFNIERTEAGLSPNRIAAMQSVFRARQNQKVPVAYVGASMRDQDLTPLLTAPGHVDSTDEYWISPLPTLTVQAFWERTARIARWRDAGRAHDVESRFITKTADDALSSLADALC